MNSNNILKHSRRQRRLSSQPPPQQQSVKRFVRLHAPFELLLELAEKTRMKLPIEVRFSFEIDLNRMSFIDRITYKMSISFFSLLLC